VVLAGASQAGVEVEPQVLPAGADAEVGGEPTAAADAATSAGVEVDRWCHTPVLKSTEPKPLYVRPGCLITCIAII
jgi:hypothetical protein